ncbi:MAG: hypothetical protein PHO70_05510 [Candidatus Omnitrophica bacterium]|nr:hypothetical protein [Candidatus Omnitrophota bacterium]
MQITINSGMGKSKEHELPAYSGSISLKKNDVLKLINYLENLLKKDGDCHFHINNFVNSIKQGQIVDIQFFRDEDNASETAEII